MSSPSLHEKWTELASKLRAEAKALPAGRARDQILQQAERLETAIAIEASFRLSPRSEPRSRPCV
jgi:hypothetical protein